MIKFEKDRHPPPKTAEGETVPTIVRAVRGVGISRIEGEVVSRGGGIRGEGCGPRRPVVAVDASVVQATVTNIDVAAAHTRWKRR